jgi:hypothetical protein
MENNNKTITAVEWLVAQLEGEESLVARIVGLKEYNQIVKLAKQMEKAQIIRARVDGDENHTFNSQMREEYAEDYYKENYGE